MDNNIQVLLIEDNLLVAKSIIDLVRALDTEKHLTFKHVASLQGAVITISSNPIDIVLLDLELPDARGTQALVALKKYWPNLVIIVITGQEIEQEEIIKLGACDYFTKGMFSGKDLVHSINKCYIRCTTAAKFEAAKESQRKTHIAIEEAKEALQEAANTADVNLSKSYPRPSSGPK